MRARAGTFFMLALACPLAARTKEEYQEDLNDRDRHIREQQNEIERLRYAAGVNVAKEAMYTPSRTAADHDLLARVASDHDVLLETATELRLGIARIDGDRAALAETAIVQARNIADQKESISALQLAWERAVGYAMGVSAVVSVSLHFAHAWFRRRLRRPV